jgi:hypothetical protein
MTGSRSTRWGRIARGAALSGASLFVASMSHVAAGGHAPGPLALSLAGAFSLIACTAIVGRALTLPRLVVGVALSQLLLHLLFSLDEGGGGPLASSGHHGVILVPTAGAAASALAPDVGMWVSHALAGLVTVALIRWSHLTARAVRSLARPFVARLRRALCVRVAPGAAASAPCPSRAAVLPPFRPWARSLSRRGPPLASY